MANMFKTVEEYAQMMIDLYHGDHEGAQVELFAASRLFPAIPPKYWRDVFLEIERRKQSAGE